MTENEQYSQIHITLPGARVIKERLQEAGLYAENPGTDAFYDLFINQIGGTQKVASGIVFAYESAIYEITDSCKAQDFPTVRSFFHEMFDRVADAIIDNKSAAEQTKYYMQDLKNDGMY